MIRNVGEERRGEREREERETPQVTVAQVLPIFKAVGGRSDKNMGHHIRMAEEYEDRRDEELV